MSESDLRRVRARCPRCNDECWATQIAGHSHTEYTSGRPIPYLELIHNILECCGCSMVYVQRLARLLPNGREYTTNYWPTPDFRRQPDWMHRQDINDFIEPKLYNLLSEIYTALDHGCHVLATTGIRTVFDLVSEVHSINQDLKFKDKLDALLSGRFISKIQKQSLKILIDAGSAAAHRAWKPSVEDIQTLMDIMEPIVYQTFIMPKQAANLNVVIQLRQQPIQPPSAELPAPPTTED